MNLAGFVLRICATAAFGLFSLQATAATVTFNYTESYGAAAPDGPAPYATATFTDTGVDEVTLTMTVADTVGLADVTLMFFNLDPTMDATSLSFAYVSGDGPTEANTNILTGEDAYRAGSDGFYDIVFDFPPPPGGQDNRFNAGEEVIYTITGAGLTAESFNYFATPGPSEDNPGPYLSVARFQNTGPDGENSDFVGAVPVPAAVWLFGSGLLGLVGIARRRRA